MKTKPIKLVTKESLKILLDNANPDKRKQIVGRALVGIFKYQTDTEMKNNETRFINGVGFTGADARSGSLTAKSFLKNNTLDDWQVEMWLKNDRLIKYHNQLNTIAIQKQQGNTF